MIISVFLTALCGVGSYKLLGPMLRKEQPVRALRFAAGAVLGVMALSGTVWTIRVLLVGSASRAATQRQFATVRKIQPEIIDAVLEDAAT